MICSKPKCRNKSDDPMVSCWLCNNIYHAKCVDLAPRTADNLREDKGLRWCCKKCIVYDTEFYSFFKNTREELNDMYNDLKNLTEKFLKYKSLFENASFSPKRKKSTPVLSSADSNPLLINQNISQNTIASSQTPNAPNSASFNITQNIETLVPPVLNEIQNNIPQSLNITTPSIIPNHQQNVINTAVHNPSDTTNPIQLKIISPKKTIFAARFSSDTTTEAITQYIKHKVGFDIDVTVFKFKYSEIRTKSSFKIIVPEENFDTIVNPEFWPPKAIIHEYEYRNTSRSDIVHLPTINDPQTSKN